MPEGQEVATTQFPEFKYFVDTAHSVQFKAFPPSVHFPLAQSLWHNSQIPAEFSTNWFLNRF